MEEEAAVLKIFMLGDYGAGKSQVIGHFVGSLTNIATIGVEFRTKIVSYKDKMYKLHIWDTAGQERFKAITSTYYKGADGIMIVYSGSHSDSNSYSNCLNWYQQIIAHGLDIPVLAIQNRSDYSSSDEDSKHLLNEFSVPVMVVNGETGLNVNDAFMTLVDMILQKNPATGTPKALTHNETITKEDQISNIIPTKSQPEFVKRGCMVF